METTHEEEDAVTSSGSISHVLQVSFRDLFSSELERCVTLERVSEYDSKVRDIKKRNEAAVQAATQSESKKGGKKAPQATAEAAALTPQLEEIPDPPLIKNAFDMLNLSDSHKDLYKERLAGTDRELETRDSEMNALDMYLAQCKIEACAAECAQEDALKRQGILVGHHVPSISSKLAVDAQMVRSMHSLPFDFLVARDIVSRNQSDMFRRTGQLPISEGAEEYSETRIKRHVVVESEVPHYLETTQLVRTRESVTKLRLSHALRDSTRKSS